MRIATPTDLEWGSAECDFMCFNRSQRASSQSGHSPSRDAPVALIVSRFASRLPIATLANPSKGISLDDIYSKLHQVQPLVVVPRRHTNERPKQCANRVRMKSLDEPRQLE
jgi:hypothetical protein